MPRGFRGYKRDKSWRRHQKHDNVNKEDKSRWNVRDFDRGEDCRFRRRQLQEMGLNPPHIAVSDALCFLRGWPGVEPVLSSITGNTTMGAIISALGVLERETDVPRAARRDSGRWGDVKAKDKARKAARRDKERRTMMSDE